MSFEAIAWAFRQELPTVRKFVLVALADYADEEATCFPSVGKTAQRVGASERTVQRALRELEVGDYLHTESVLRSNGSHTSNRYHLHLNRTEGGPRQSVTTPRHSVTTPGDTGVTPLTTITNHQENHSGDASVAGEVELPLEGIKDKPKTAKTTAPSSRYSAEFETWWARYPSTAGKVAAGKAFDKLVREGRTATELDELLSGYLLGRQLAESRGEFVPTLPHAATWLNQEKWDDVERPAAPSASATTASLELGQDDVDRILGRDYWTPPAPPAGLDLLAEREWRAARIGEHRAERARAALASLSESHFDAAALG